jgi:indole-3-glycerol phosphate synthase
MPVTLDEILTSTRGRLDQLRGRGAALTREAEGTPRPASFRAALCRSQLAVVAEVKRRSPSAGAINEDLDPAQRAELYATHGAAAISVLTDGPYFGGSLADLAQAACRVQVPILRKDFILDELQLLEARAAGAAAVLLIVRALTPARLGELLGFAREWGLEALVEVHTSPELSVALDAGSEIIGVNSRDLDSFRIDTRRAWEILRVVPRDRVAVAESGMSTVADIERAAQAGADAVLVGTALSAASSPADLLQAFCQVARRGR